jgi:hypothetical protein
LKRTIANCTGFQTAFSARYSDAAASAEVRTAKVQNFARRVWLLARVSRFAKLEDRNR